MTNWKCCFNFFGLNTAKFILNNTVLLPFFFQSTRTGVSKIWPVHGARSIFVQPLASILKSIIYGTEINYILNHVWIWICVDFIYHDVKMCLKNMKFTKEDTRLDQNYETVLKRQPLIHNNCSRQKKKCLALEMLFTGENSLKNNIKKKKCDIFSHS